MFQTTANLCNAVLSALAALCVLASGCSTSGPGDRNCLPQISEGMSPTELATAIEQATEDWGPGCELYMRHRQFTHRPPRHIYTTEDQGAERMCLFARVHPHARCYFSFVDGKLVQVYDGRYPVPRVRDDLTVDLSALKPIPLATFDETIRARLLPGVETRERYLEPSPLLLLLFPVEDEDQTNEYREYRKLHRDRDGARIRLHWSPDEVRALWGPPADILTDGDVTRWRYITRMPARYGSRIVNVWFDDSGVIAVWSEIGSKLR